MVLRTLQMSNIQYFHILYNYENNIWNIKKSIMISASKEVCIGKAKELAKQSITKKRNGCVEGFKRALILSETIGKKKFSNNRCTFTGIFVEFKEKCSGYGDIMHGFIMNDITNFKTNESFLLRHNGSI